MTKFIRRVPLVGAVLLIAVAGAGYLWLTDFRLMLDGSGWRPRLESSAPNYDALEADRARQRQEAASAPAMPPVVETAAVPASSPASTASSADAESARPTAESTSPQVTWADFRGPNRDGRVDVPIRTEWPRDGLPLLWKQPIGLGYASFVVADGRAFTIEQRRQQEVAAAYDVNSGRELWTNAWDGEFVESMGGDGPRATPTYAGGRLYVLGALGEFRCLDARTGSVVWRRNILADAGAANLSWGMSGAPLIVDDTVVVLPGGRGKSVTAYSRASGQPVWSALDDEAGYVSPMLVTLGGVRQLLIVTGSRIVGITPDSGSLLWEHPWPTFNGINASQPLLLGNDRVFLSSGYGQGAIVLELTRTGESFTVRTVWQNTRMKNKFTSSVLHGGYIYGLDEAILACIDAATGDLKWKGGRYGYGQILLAGDRIIVLTEDGEVALVDATPERHRELARFEAIDGKTWNHPVVAEGRLLVRNLREMAAFDIRP